MDETLIPFKGKTQILQYIPNKPYKWGLKVWTLAELKTGYVLKITKGLARQADLPLCTPIFRKRTSCLC